MTLVKIPTLSFFLALSICACYGQTEKENSDELKILKEIKPLSYRDEGVKTLIIPKRKYDSPLYCDEIIQYKTGFIVNSITSGREGRQIDFTTKFFYYNPVDKSLKKITVSKADTIESIVCSGSNSYCSFIKNGKRGIGYFENNQYQSIIDKASTDIRRDLDTAKWIKLGIENDRLYILSPNYLFEFSNNEYKILTNYSLDDFYINTLKYRRSISMLPTKNVVVQNNSAYFLQEIVQDRTCNLLKLDIASGKIDDYFTSLGYIDDYLKQINDFTVLDDSSLLVSASRLLGNQMLINSKGDKVDVWAFNNSIITPGGTNVEFPVTTALNCNDTIILASSQGLYLKYTDTIKPLVYFGNYHQDIKIKIGLLDFSFEPRSIKKSGDHTFIIGGMWGGLYQVDILNNKLICLDDIDYDKINSVELSEL